MKTQTLALFFLVATAIGGIAWVFIYPHLSGERHRELALRRRVGAEQVVRLEVVRIGLDDPSLTDAEISTIARWVDAGAPQGNPADMPPPKQFSDLDRGIITAAAVAQRVGEARRIRPREI